MECDYISPCDASRETKNNLDLLTQKLDFFNLHFGSKYDGLDKSLSIFLNTNYPDILNRLSKSETNKTVLTEKCERMVLDIQDLKKGKDTFRSEIYGDLEKHKAHDREQVLILAKFKTQVYTWVSVGGAILTGLTVWSKFF